MLYERLEAITFILLRFCDIVNVKNWKLTLSISCFINDAFSQCAYFFELYQSVFIMFFHKSVLKIWKKMCSIEMKIG